ncbi:MAG TPA: S49 family peptidase, partial [Vicinamibacterales bacterium]|nr:S49 family peptidase [Vicinamibacterales bacterium]
MARRGLSVLFTLLGIAVFISIAGFFALYLVFGREPSVASRSTLVLQVGGNLGEVAPADVVGYLRGVRTPTVRSVVDNLRKAKADARIRAVLLKPTGFSSPFWAKVQEIRDAVLEFRKSGKPVYAYLEYGGDREYYLATAADKIFLMPSAPLDLTGVATYELFLRGTLDKIGAYPDLHHIGDYKTAINTFTQKTFTPTHREMDESLNRDLYDQIVRGIADGRKKTDAEIRQRFDEGPFLPEDALHAGLIDDVAYEDQVDDKLGDGARQHQLDGDEYARVALTSVGLNRGPR